MGQCVGREFLTFCFFGSGSSEVLPLWSLAWAFFELVATFPLESLGESLLLLAGTMAAVMSWASRPLYLPTIESVLQTKWQQGPLRPG